MRPTRTTIVPLAAVLAAVMLATPATARPIDSPGHRQPAASATPPSQDLRSPDARDAADGRTTRDATATTAQDLRSPDARDATDDPTTSDITAALAQERAYSSYGEPTPITTQASHATGFDWADAAIGAGGATGLLAISLAGAMTLRRRHSDPRSRTAIG